MPEITLKNAGAVVGREGEREATENLGEAHRTITETADDETAEELDEDNAR